MKLYKAQLELHSPLGTSLKGDTIWGHIVWGIANHEGQSYVADFLNAFREGTPSMIVSSAFPVGMLPRPKMVDNTPFKILSKQEYAEIKEKKKQRYIHSFLDEHEVKTATYGHFVKQIQMHNTIGRIDLTVQDDGLFASEALWADREKFEGKKPLFDLYVLSSFQPERIYTLLEWAFENGYGSDTSTGKGVIQVLKNVEEVEMLPVKGQRCLALGPFVLDGQAIPDDLLSDVFIRRGKIGGAFASSVNPYKKTMIMFAEGSTFTHQSELPYVGSIIQNIHTDERICHSGFCPILPLPTGVDDENTL